MCLEDCDPCNEGIDSANKTNEVSVLETISASEDKPISDYVSNINRMRIYIPLPKMFLSRMDTLKMQETKFETSTVAASSDMEKATWTAKLSSVLLLDKVKKLV